MVVDRDEWLRRILALHFDPEGGAPYWLERQRQLGFSVRDRIGCIDDLALMGPMELDVLRHRPIEDLIPRSQLGRFSLITAQTGGATGMPKTTAFSQDDFEASFVVPFLETARALGCSWPSAGHWLWIGPGGPHIIGKAAHRIAEQTTGSDPFSVDFDPRWFRRLAEHSLARKRYLEHVLEQARNIIRVQKIACLFTTPAILTPLADLLSTDQCGAVTFIYLGGMRVTRQVFHEYRSRFVNATVLSGYGNSLFGVCHQRGEVEEGLCYYPSSPQIVSRVVAWITGVPGPIHFSQEVAYGSRGQVVMHRLQESALLINVVEQDDAIRVPPLPDGPPWDGLGDPGRLEQRHLIVDDGIY
ncbi:MAG: hypothetical protein HQL76_01265 [Magnetococcales bacterium]|nr:hypothetical protein [Magnetococcales bacterium]